MRTSLLCMRMISKPCVVLGPQSTKFKNHRGFEIHPVFERVHKEKKRSSLWKVPSIPVHNSYWFGIYIIIIKTPNICLL